MNLVEVAVYFLVLFFNGCQRKFGFSWKLKPERDGEQMSERFLYH